MREHTKEPWGYEPTGNQDDEYWITWTGHPTSIGVTCNAVTGPGSKDAEANARRIVACVNACCGIPTAALETIGRITLAAPPEGGGPAGQV